MPLRRSPAPMLVYSVMLVFTYCCTTGQSTTTCTRSPTITGYSRPHGLLISLYNFTWQPSNCHFRGITQYQFQFIENCPINPPQILFTGSNKTTKTISIQQCSNGNCYMRIRAELSDGSVTDYSPCVLINSQLLTVERSIQHYYQDVCVHIHGSCDGAVSEFFVNGQHMLWPWPGTSAHYNVTITQNPRMYSFCFSNVSSHTTLTEYCYQDHSMGCSLCSADSGQIYFLSQIVISTSVKENEYSTTVSPSFTETAGSVASITASSMYYTSLAETDLPVPLYDSERKMDGADTTLAMVSIANVVTQNTTKIVVFKPPLTIIDTISIIIPCIVLGIAVFVITTAVIILHRNKSKKCLSRNPQTENIYDEVSLPDSIYHEITIKIQKESEARIEMMGNDSYVATTSIILKDP